MLKIMIEVLNLRTSKDEMDFQRGQPKIGIKRFLLLKKLKTLFHGYVFPLILMVKKMMELFLEKIFKIESKRFLELEK